MLHRINVNDGVAVTVQTRATGAVRLSMDHAFVDLQRCEMTPAMALFLADALTRAADVLKMTEQQRAVQWPVSPESFGGA